MNNNRPIGLIYHFLLILSITSCVFEDGADIAPENVSNNIDFQFPSDFDFRTSREIDVQAINGRGTYTLSYGEDQQYVLGKYVATGNPVTLTIPSYLKEINVKYLSDTGSSRTASLDIDNQTMVEFDLDKGQVISSGRAQACEETLYAVNNKGGFYSINIENGLYESKDLGGLQGGGSIASAVDKLNGKVYYNVGNTLMYYDFNNSTFHTAQNGNPFNGSYPRMEYNPVDNNLYIARNEDMHIIDPLTNEVLNTFEIKGLESPVSGGDIAISKDGTIYMCCFSGLYRIAIEGDIAFATRISAENLPYSPTSMAIDRNDRLYLATNDANSQLIEMDKFDGAWQVIQTYNHTINDLGSFKCDVSELADIDTDGDGVIDAEDDYPDDPGAATTAYSPSDIGWGSLAYEDLWPSQGDYDFNDLVLNYRFIQVANSDNEVVRLIAKFRIKAIGASLHNGFGLKMNVDPELVTSVSGYNLTQQFVNLDSKGLEQGHTTGSVIVVFDDAFDNISGAGAGWFINTQKGAPKVVGEELEITVQFTRPITTEEMGAAPFDPFIFIGGNRGREIHLADYSPTDLADASLFNSMHDDSDHLSGKYYRGDNNMPWAINIIHDFRQPLEKIRIDGAYIKFTQWGQSKGLDFNDWYTDVNGYRNLDKIYTE